MTTIKGPSKKAPSGRQVFDELKGLITESINPRTRNIDRLSTRAILKAINREDATVATVVAKEIPYIAMAVEMAIKTFKNKGRLFYVGAGTSGRLGVLDAAECPPTFGTDPKMIKGIIAGGYDSLIRSKEGVEDNIEAAIADIKKNRIKSNDMVIGITASKRTPYVLAALREAKKQKASTVFICCQSPKDSPERVRPLDLPRGRSGSACGLIEDEGWDRSKNDTEYDHHHNHDSNGSGVWQPHGEFDGNLGKTEGTDPSVF